MVGKLFNDLFWYYYINILLTTVAYQTYIFQLSLYFNLGGLAIFRLVGDFFYLNDSFLVKNNYVVPFQV